MVGITSLLVLAVVFGLHKEFVTISLDRESARAITAATLAPLSREEAARLNALLRRLG